ncbi:MAG TPA: folylpolyglutamate synthase/dihydrofolate synthase family protein [Candidatus Acidoferrum sp.]|nr:folylpolyglutamate synthase/dihydrofolate synthase family protein [Candidatus Acidoferrum sp.]
MEYNESVRYLLTLGRELAAPSHAKAAKFDLANIRALALRMGTPQKNFSSVHIAGTNGKGSTAAMVERILRSAGFKTGLYTSPHLERINERIRVNGAEISDAEFAAAFTRQHGLIEAMLSTGELAAHPTYFECVTAMALDVFARERVEFAVLEVGMGGRLDSTNIVVPEVSVITQIAFDHEAFLGHSIAEIAGEKAGIIKPGVPVVSAAEHPEARAAIRRRAEELEAPLVEIDTAYRLEELNSKDGFYSGSVVDLGLDAAHETVKSAQPGVAVLPAAVPLELKLGLAGRYQMRNAVTAMAAARLLAGRGYKITDEDIAEGIARVQWPGRLERIAEGPTVFLDGTHNAAGARELAEFWDEHLAGRRIHLVYGSVRDKSVDEIAGLLFPRAARVTVTAPGQPRALSAEALAEMTRHLAPEMDVVAEASEAVAQAVEEAGREDVVFVTGSLYLVGEISRWWKSGAAQARSAAKS